MMLFYPQTLSGIRALWDQILAFGLSLLQPYRLWQVVIVLVLFVVAHLIARPRKHRHDACICGHDALAMWQARMLIILHNRPRGVVFVALAATITIRFGLFSCRCVGSQRR